ncbi:hypothetical protein GCM10010251_97190 [Streptomyces aurantiogriseus]|uniref:Uncharacterized protein n=1 Tax=Streptomyces aurantiogriseus TaxID=66870 RepID=A0A918FPQ9_9ACTN|nr:hypothetical protein GCM10010251_97190 [Streptomyces aurantiogriseus]
MYVSALRCGGRAMRPEETLDIKLAFAGWFAGKPAAELAEMEAEAYA